MICVSPSYAYPPSAPWYADHPTNRLIRQESFILKAVVPLVEKYLPAIPQREGRYLIGYSKAGFGAFTLLLRHPDVFWKAASWDAPMTMKYNDWGSSEIYGTPDNYRLYYPPNLFTNQAAIFAGGPERFVLLGSKIFSNDTAAAHAIMTNLNIPHYYDNTLVFEHDFRSGWASAAFAHLFESPPRSLPGR